MPKIIQTVFEYLQIQSKAFASLCFSASPPRIGYLSLWMHQGLSPPWFITPRGISATKREIEASDQIPHPIWVVIKCPAPEVHQISSLPGSKRRQMPGVCPGGGGGTFKLWFDWYISSNYSGVVWKRPQLMQRLRPKKTGMYLLSLFVYLTLRRWKRNRDAEELVGHHICQRFQYQPHHSGHTLGQGQENQGTRIPFAHARSSEGAGHVTEVQSDQCQGYQGS